MYYRFCVILMILRPLSLEAADSASKLCERINLSCSSQVPNFNLTDDDCKMIQRGRNSQECSSLVFNKPSYAAALGNVVLQAYFHDSSPTDPQTAFNVSFTHISWTSIIIRFLKIKEPEENTCKEFQVSEKFLAFDSIPLFYDCIWSHYEYEGQTYYFEYSARNSSTSSYGKYVFTVPEHSRINPKTTSLKNWELFMYVDITNSPIVILKFQTLQHFGVTNYSVEAISGNKPNEVIRDRKIVFTENDEGSYEWNLGIFPVSYYFIVTPLSPVCDNNSCHPSKSPDIRRDLPIIPILIGGVAVTFIFLILFCVYVKMKIKIGLPEVITEKPTLLLIYHGTHTSHIKVVLQLAKYFKDYNLIVMVDELDVNRSQTQDPFNWYNDAIAKADFIAIVSSPRCCSSVKSIYQNAERIALGLLNEIRFRRTFSKVYNLMYFLLPYCSKNDLLEKTENIGLCFKVPNQLHEILYYVHNLREMCFLEKFFHLIKAKGIFIWSLVRDQNCINKDSILPAIQEASEEVRSCRANGDSVLNNNTHNNIEGTLETLKKLDTIMKIENSCDINTLSLQDSTLSEATPILEYPFSLNTMNLSGSDDDEFTLQSDTSEPKDISFLDQLPL